MFENLNKAAGIIRNEKQREADSEENASFAEASVRDSNRASFTQQSTEFIDKARNGSAMSTSGSSEPSFFMPIEDVFRITGRGTIVVGTVSQGSISLYDPVEVVTDDGRRFATAATAIEMFNKVLDSAITGDSVSILLRGIQKEDILNARALVNPGGNVRLESIL